MKKCLILGRKGTVVNEVAKAINLTNIELFEGTSLEEVKNTMESHDIDVVIMGAGLDIKLRLEIIEYVFSQSKSTTVHMKDWDSGPGGILPFVLKVLTGM